MISSLRQNVHEKPQTSCPNRKKLCIGLAKNPFSFFPKIKDTFFTFTKNIIDLDTLSVGSLPCGITLIVLN